jgi:hypothetical protein
MVIEFELEIVEVFEEGKMKVFVKEIEKVF